MFGCYILTNVPTVVILNNYLSDFILDILVSIMPNDGFYDQS